MLPPAAERAYLWILCHVPPIWRIYIQYFRSFKRLPNLKSPKAFSEKLQLHKLSTDPIIARLADKVAVKSYVVDRIGTDMVIPSLFSGSSLPSVRDWQIPFVIKCNHGSGLNIFVRETPDWHAIERKLDEFMRYDLGRVTGELFYSRIPRQVLVEPFISKTGELPTDYKMFVFSGHVHFIQVDTARETDHRRAFYSPQWEKLDIKFKFPTERVNIEKPKSLDTMLWAASKLGRDLPFARIDFYEIDGLPYFGEITFTPEAGYAKFDPASLDEELGKLWDDCASNPISLPT